MKSPTFTSLMDKTTPEQITEASLELNKAEQEIRTIRINDLGQTAIHSACFQAEDGSVVGEFRPQAAESAEGGEGREEVRNLT